MESKLRFPLQVVAKSRTAEDHRAYYRWVHFITGREYNYDRYPYRKQWVWEEVVGYRTRWFHSFMDAVPTCLWRRLPLAWQTAYLFGDPTHD